MYEDLVKNIDKLLEQKEVIVVAISGHGGSGKTTLARKLANDFNVETNQIVRIDNVHAKDYLDAKDLFGVHDWNIIAELLSNLHDTDRLKYQTRDWKGVEGEVDVPRPNLVIIEGIRLIRPETQKHFDLSVWIDCPIELATKRALDRNREQGDSQEELDLWYTKWVPEAKRYVAEIKPHEIADFIYTNPEN